LPDEKPVLNLGEAASLYMGSMRDDQRRAAQAEISRFVQWCGGRRRVGDIRPPEVAKYAEQLSPSDAGYAQRLAQVRDFLQYLRKSGAMPLAAHLKAKKVKPRGVLQNVRHKNVPITLTTEGQAAIKAEIVELKIKREDVIGQVSRAAADKDFRENAPLHAAKEEYGKIEGRLRELEETLKRAVVADASAGSGDRVVVGSEVCLCDLAAGGSLSYRLVSSRETDPRRGKISGDSPLGQALLGRSVGDEVTVKTPVGQMRYRITSLRD